MPPATTADTLLQAQFWQADPPRTFRGQKQARRT